MRGRETSIEREDRERVSERERDAKNDLAGARGEMLRRTGGNCETMDGRITLMGRE